MRAIFFSVLVLCFLMGYTSESSAFWWKFKQEGQQGEQSQGKKTAISRELANQQQLREKKRKQLNNTEWEIELILFGDKKKKKDRDYITFKNNQISSSNLIQSGFAPTNYSLTVQEDGTIIWETMQSSKKGDIAFLRGEIEPSFDKMKGILSHRVNNRAAKDYYFSSLGKKSVAASQ